MKRLHIFICSFLFAGPLGAQQMLTLEQIMAIAAQNSPDLRTSELSLTRSQELLNAQRAAQKSQFSLTLNPFTYRQSRSFDDYYSEWYTNKSYSSFGTFTVSQPLLFSDGTLSLSNRFGWQENDTETSKGIGIDKSFVNNLNLSYTQPLFTYNRQKQRLQQLELDMENTQLSYAMQRLNLERQVTQYFYNVYMAQMNLSISEEELKNTEKSYEITKSKVEADLVAKEDLYQAELNYANSRSTVQNRKVSLEDAKDNLKQYIGMDLSEEIGVITSIEANPVDVDVEKAVEHGLLSRMELRQRQIAIENAQFTLIQTKAENEFRGDVTLSVGLTGQNEQLNKIFKDQTSSPSIGLTFNVPLFDWGEKKSRIKAQEATIQQQDLSLDVQRIDIELGIRQIYRNLQNLINQIEIARQSEQNAQLTYEINLERYANGDLTSMDLNLYQTQLSERKIAYAQALINYKIELLNLKIQSLYDFENKTGVVPEEILKKTN
ncbi:MAG: TolC family protein [Bacteroidales bacterium]|jgi:outer membrane protein TolC|nr:TolC family protein [Bacteroidales bacterium]